MSRRTSISAAVLAAATAAAALSACGKSDAPSKEVFAAALEPVVRDVFCHPIDVMPFDVEGEAGRAAFPVITSPKREVAGPGSDGRAVAMLDAGASAGFLTRTEVEKRARWKGTDRPFVRQTLISYAPTDKGAPYLRAVERQATTGTVTVPSFCMARGEVVDVVRWTEPTDIGGRRTTRVTYTYRGVDPVPVMPKAEQAAMAEPKEATVPFELQSDGWRPMPS